MQRNKVSGNGRRKELTKLKVKRNGEPLLKNPAIGALKAAAKPALAPLLIKIFLQTWCFAAIDYSLVNHCT